jgi:hypothetical protein
MYKYFLEKIRNPVITSLRDHAEEIIYILHISDWEFCIDIPSKRRQKALKMQKNGQKTKNYRVRACVYEK